MLCRFDLSDFRIVEHAHHPIDWEAPEHPLCKYVGAATYAVFGWMVGEHSRGLQTLET